MAGLPPFQIPDSVPSKGPGTDGVGKRPGPGYMNPPVSQDKEDKDHASKKTPKGHKKDKHRPDLKANPDPRFITPKS